MARPSIPLSERFWSKVLKTSDGCWFWTGYIGKHGYGQLNISKHVTENAHRIAWQLTYGPIVDGSYVLHRCDNQQCVNPNHLFLGTQLDNMRDMDAKGRRSTNPPPHPKGMEQPRSKLTDDDVLAIRAMYEIHHIPQHQIAKRYNVTRSAVWDIVHRKNWRHI